MGDLDTVREVDTDTVKEGRLDRDPVMEVVEDKDKDVVAERHLVGDPDLVTVRVVERLREVVPDRVNERPEERLREEVAVLLGSPCEKGTKRLKESK